MDQSSFPSYEFALPLPLRWPANERDRLAYESMLIVYAQTMVPLLEGSERGEAEQLLAALEPMIQDLKKLWPSDSTPAEIAGLLRFFPDNTREGTL